MRIRSIKPEFWRSDDIDTLDWHTRLLFIGLWSYVDDNGVGRDRVSDIVADLFAGDLSGDPPETLRRVTEGLDALSQGGQIVRYVSDGRAFLFILEWDKHQQISHPNKPRYPRPTREDTKILEPLPKSSGKSPETLPTGAGEQGNRGTDKTPPASRPPRGKRLPDDWAPTTDLLDWASREHPSIDPQAETAKFCDYWRSLAGAKASKIDWAGTWRNWIRNARPSPTINGKPRNQQETETWLRDAMQDAAAADEAHQRKEIGA